MTDAKMDYSPAAADARYAELGGDESVIPKGSYCYNIVGFEPGDEGQPPRIKTQTCPYWATRQDAPEQAYSYCAKLKSGDWEEDGPFLLWDQVKECGVNHLDDDEEDAAQEKFAELKREAEAD